MMGLPRKVQNTRLFVGSSGDGSHLYLIIHDLRTLPIGRAVSPLDPMAIAEATTIGAVNAIATIGMLADANAPSSQRSGEHYHVAGFPFARSTLRAVGRLLDKSTRPSPENKEYNPVERQIWQNEPKFASMRAESRSSSTKTAAGVGCGIGNRTKVMFPRSAKGVPKSRSSGRK